MSRAIHKKHEATRTKFVQLRDPRITIKQGVFSWIGLKFFSRVGHPAIGKAAEKVYSTARRSRVAIAWASSARVTAVSGRKSESPWSKPLETANDT